MNRDDQQSDFDAFMGIDADPRMTGNFFLQTNAQAPYSRGKSGMVYEPTIVWTKETLLLKQVP